MSTILNSNMMLPRNGPRTTMGLSRLFIGPNTSVNSIYYDHVKDSANVYKRFASFSANKPYLKLPNKQLIFNRKIFKNSPGFHRPSIRSGGIGIAFKNPRVAFRVTSNTRLFSSYRHLKNKLSEIDAARRKKQQSDKFIKWWTVTSIPLVFFGLLARAEYKNQQEKAGDDEDDDFVVRPTSWKFFAYQALPLNAISRLWGKFNSIELPVWAREPGFKFYSYLFGVNMDEIKEDDLKKFRNLGEFFYRELKDGARSIDSHEVVCPSDGKVLSFGMINEHGEIEQVKGMSYSVKKFLGIRKSTLQKIKEVNDDEANEIDHREFAKINGISYTVDDLLGINNDKEIHHFLKHINVNHRGDQSLVTSEIKDNKLDATKLVAQGNPAKKLFYSVIYLAPGDYHRFHSPTNWVVQARKYFTGELYSVAPYFQETFQNLFILNERVSLLGYWKHGFFSMTPVGATNVGSVKINFDKELVTNKKYDPYNSNERFVKNSVYEATYFNNSKSLGGIPLNKGVEMGGFELGSTVVLVFEAPADQFEFKVEPGQVVRMGEALGGVREQ
ncbi:phosphatidylserine decarboxylase 1 [Saccharomycopsis crataegensis]|uniref:Phosphatidylserine decarboxylase proenzyme 1, mitochondrial n=1 Tax=Saccharomycopsis crataegensis TaxID=43959 RepID=A0AAV5QTS3_9ASCO|nr:phosphatidylserine decarboxylase 1 [Saccharomycopsis crataegensis]